MERIFARSSFLLCGTGRAIFPGNVRTFSTGHGPTAAGVPRMMSLVGRSCTTSAWETKRFCPTAGPRVGVLTCAAREGVARKCGGGLRYFSAEELASPAPPSSSGQNDQSSGQSGNNNQRNKWGLLRNISIALGSGGALSVLFGGKGKDDSNGNGDNANVNANDKSTSLLHTVNINIKSIFSRNNEACCHDHKEEVDIIAEKAKSCSRATEPDKIWYSLYPKCEAVDNNNKEVREQLAKIVFDSKPMGVLVCGNQGCGKTNYLRELGSTAATANGSSITTFYIPLKGSDNIREFIESKLGDGIINKNVNPIQ